MTNPSPTASNLSTILLRISSELEKESTLKESIKESLQPIDNISRGVTALLNRAHSTKGDELPALATEALKQISEIRSLWIPVVEKIPQGEVYKFAYTSSNILKSLTTSVVLSYFLLHDDLATLEQITEVIGVNDEWKDRLQLSPDDYLQGVIGTSNELARLALNSVTNHNFTLPLRIATFEKELFAGFSLLNLRNDALRRRFDSLKYDVKRCEDVVYDITLRGLVPASSV